MVFGKIFGEFVDVIDWLDDSPDTLVYRYERHGNEIKFGAKLTVREGQSAVFVNEGEIADVFSPGMYELLTANLPVLSTLQNWPHGFQSPFKSEVYFFNMRRFTDLKWGTKNPIICRDPEFGPIRVRAFGTYVIRIADPEIFLREIVGTDGHFTTAQITNQIRNIILARFADVIGKSRIPIIDLAGNYEQLSTFLTAKIGPEVAVYGLELTKMLVENVSLPADVEKALDQRSAAGMVGDLSRYMTYQTGQSLTTPNSGAATGVGVAAGLGMAQQMAAGMQGGFGGQPAGAVPPPLHAGRRFHVAANGQPTGPYELQELASQARAGSLSRETLVWSEGMAGWTAAGDVPELAGLFSAAPPPVPPLPSTG